MGYHNQNALVEYIHPWSCFLVIRDFHLSLSILSKEI